MLITKDYYSGEYDEELGRDPLFTASTLILNLPDEYEIEDIKIVWNKKLIVDKPVMDV